MFDSSLVSQFITNIKIIDFGQKVIIDCCPFGEIEGDNNYQLMCLKCEQLELICYEAMEKDRCIDLVEFSITEQTNNKTGVYIYGGGVKLNAIYEEVQMIK